MILTLDDIRAVTVGAIEVEERDGGFHFLRCTKKQTEAWRNLVPILGERSLATNGVRLDFVTDARAITFSAAAGNYELHIDELLRAKYLHTNENEKIAFSLCDPLGREKAEYRVTLYLPSHTIGVLRSLSLEGASYIRPLTYDCRLLVLGDSITQGWESEYDSMTYAYALSRALHANSIIQGVGGGVFHVSTLDTLPFDPDIVTIAFGTNDYDRCPTPEDMRANVSDYLDWIASSYGDKKVFVISPIWRDKVIVDRFEACRAVVIEEAARRGIIHIDGLAMVPPFPSLYSDAFLHPNTLGFAYYSENVVRAIQKHLKK